ncbi:MAG: NAD(P)-binding protein [Halorientalis sp.]
MTERRDVAVVGGGVAGLTAGVFTARHGLDTLLLDSEAGTPTGNRPQADDGDESILKRNAHLENVPGFPAGVDARLFLEMLGDQADRAGCDRIQAQVTDAALTADGAGFSIETSGGDNYEAKYLVAATRNTVDYLRGIDGLGFVDREKTFVECNECGETGVDGLYVAGRLAEKPYQTAICAGHGAEVAVTLLDDHERPFYHDWIAPEGYFSGRDRDVPPGCEEIDDAEREAREQESLEVMREYFADPHPSEPTQHPSVADDE